MQMTECLQRNSSGKQVAVTLGVECCCQGR